MHFGIIVKVVIKGNDVIFNNNNNLSYGSGFGCRNGEKYIFSLIISIKRITLH